MIDMQSPKLSQRERAKKQRRDRIVEAATSLLREIPHESVSVKMIAERSGLSATTVFNLFGTKSAIFSKVFDRDAELFESKVMQFACEDALDRAFIAIDVAIGLYRDDEPFYRATVWEHGLELGEGAHAHRHEPRMRFWKNILSAAEQEGSITLNGQAEPAAEMIIFLWRGAMADWIAGGRDLDGLRTSVRFEIASLLAAWALPEAQARVRRWVNLPG